MICSRSTAKPKAQVIVLNADKARASSADASANACHNTAARLLAGRAEPEGQRPLGSPLQQRIVLFLPLVQTQSFQQWQ